MDRNLVAILSKQIVSFVRDNLASRLATSIDENTDGRSTEEVIVDSLTSLLAEIEISPAAASSSIPVVGSTPKTASKPSSKKTDALKSSTGEILRCDMTIKKTGEPCTFPAKQTIGGKNYCGVHAKSANNAQPDPNKKPSASKSGGNKGTTTFGSVVGGIGSSSSSSFSGANITIGADLHIGDDE